MLKKLAIFFVLAILGTSWEKAISYHLFASLFVGLFIGATTIWLVLRARISSAEIQAKGESQVEIARLKIWLHDVRNVRDKLIKNVTLGYESLQFHKVFHTIYNFCSVEMSAFYLDILMDRLYTFTKNSRERRADRSTVRLDQPRYIIGADNRSYGGRGVVCNPA